MTRQHVGAGHHSDGKISNLEKTEVNVSRINRYMSAIVLSSAIANTSIAQEWDLNGASGIEGDAQGVIDAANGEIGKIDDGNRYEDHWNEDGWNYSLAFSANLTQAKQTQNDQTNKTSDQNYAVSAVVNNGQGRFEQRFSLMASYAQSNQDDPHMKLGSSYHVASSLGEKSYAFSTIGIRGEYSDAQSMDAYAGAGFGTRLLNDENIAWRVEAGPSIHYTTASGLGATNAFGAIARSEFYYKLSDKVSLSNDTQLQWTEAFQKVNNDFGINFAINENLTTRVGYISDFHQNDSQKLSEESNQLRVSTVLSF